MYPKDNIFNIYYEIGKRVPFQVKRSPWGLKGSNNVEYRYSQEGVTYMVTRVFPKGKYGYAWGYLLYNGERNEEMQKEYFNGRETIPCAGCGEWCLIDIPGVSKEEVEKYQDAKDFCHSTYKQTNDPHPTLKIIELDDTMPFGKYKGKTLQEVIDTDKSYIEWVVNNVKDYQLKLS